MSPLDARVLRAVDPMRVRSSVERIARTADCEPGVALSTLRRLRGRMLVEEDGERPAGWLRTRDGDIALERRP